MSWNLLERFIESEHFNKDPSLTVAYLARYAEHVGIHYVLCSKLRQFSYEEIEFFLPQLCHLLISIDNESMALEEFLIDLCEESVNGALLTFWLFQTYLHDLAPQPASNAFQTCRRLYNKVQRIVFSSGEPLKREKIQENVLPVTVLSSLVLAGIALPVLPQHAGPLAIAQARRPRPIEDLISEALPPAQKLGRSATVTGSTSTSKKVRPGSSDSKQAGPRRPKRPSAIDVSGVAAPRTLPITPRTDGKKASSHRQSLAAIRNSEAFSSTASLPVHKDVPPAASVPTSAGVPRRPSEPPRRHSHASRPTTPSTVSRSHRTRMLRQNYFRSQTQFLAALEGISSRLVSVPKPARLSALRAELALIAQDLPAEVDIPLICPATLIDGSASRSRHHRIVRLNPAEATSLNSAEKVPYLLMLEVLREDFDFDSESEQNVQLLAELLSEKGKPKRRLFDTSDAARKAAINSQNDTTSDSVLEPTNGDLSSAALLKDANLEKSGSPVMRGTREPPRLSSGVSTISSDPSLATPRNSEGPDAGSDSPALRSSPYIKPQNPTQSDVSALADHMRMASQMLAQLELSAAKRPKTEVAAIKAKIIASMQSLEEQSFLNDDALGTPNFDQIMAKASAAAAQTGANDIENDELDVPADPAVNSGKGAARMENDAMTGGIQRANGDRDDPSAATFGEAWEQKKERIRRSSPYGWVKNWDLISVIVKTGADLRQEAFACQLIAVCDKIFSEHKVDVWVKNMRILVTGESSGLIETITNAVSLHSLKRSLTLASITAGTNPKKRIATLQDHYAKTFGPVDSPAYQAAIDCFVRSLAAYSIISYILQLKDRHNGNILIDSEGHVIHIDFGFMLYNSPGNMGFEAAPFKLTSEYLELLGPVDGAPFTLFKDLIKEAFQALRREAERIVTLVELMGRESRKPCYGGGVVTVMAALRARFVLERSEQGAREFVDELVGKSAGSYYTRLYDTFQYRTQGIY
ncbi:Phosphatidylinositol 4-kinase pik1alpha (PI4-kinase)(PtdIns-4-kinase) [Recurvomyces mirabilis]|uniref:1-phosphatidylinositol 4-kinase n=1 Tax=Recurvomyces mirabilis TaxID=574656 RepID=A0AAE0TQI0_9PEZI|nr:Phosphatidylinositol 4-kinase pik1alpha (PI4-kinase)(PtdIns-4-kinase) [Recurvomyces mirabilis]KAK5150664.1 Phosphatidylinositol 4-kinase pik1alpha (PI4-kinase)(PtdIns-4-kinase) [Recurvomyces mirabilis]